MSVFIVQEPMIRDSASGNLIPQFDFRQVLEYGSPVVCLPPGRVALTPGPTVAVLRSKLRDFNDEDYLVATGDPSAIAIAAAIACDNNMGRMKLLKWDKNHKRYIMVAIDLYPERRNRDDN